MNTDHKPRSGAGEAPASTTKADVARQPTTETDAASPAAGGAGGHGTPAQAAMKQQSKTESERGSER